MECILCEPTNVFLSQIAQINTDRMDYFLLQIAQINTDRMDYFLLQIAQINYRFMLIIMYLKNKLITNAQQSTANSFAKFI